MYKVAIDTGILKSGHAVRGIGVNTGQLLQALEKIKNSEFEFAGVDFRQTDLSGYDLLHYQYFHPYFLSLPFKKKTKSIITIHDLIYLIYPQAYPPGIKGRLRFLLQKYLIQNMDGIITISETSKNDIVRLLNVPADKVQVIYLAPKGIFRKLENGNWKTEISSKYGLPDRFVLYVGDMNYNKNVMTLAEACKILKIPLVIVGKQAADEKFDHSHIENRPLADFLDKYGNDKDIIRLGFVPDEDLTAIYNLAFVYCQPSFYEGFGLPVLEAQAAGCPVIASDISAHREIAGDSVKYFNPPDPKDLKDKFIQMLSDQKLREKLQEQGFKNVRKYSWEKTAGETASYYKKILR